VRSTVPTILAPFRSAKTHRRAPKVFILANETKETLGALRRSETQPERTNYGPARLSMPPGPTAHGGKKERVFGVVVFRGCGGPAGAEQRDSP